MISKDLRKQLKLPITKEIVYYRRLRGKEYIKFDVESIEILEQYNPSGSYSLQIVLSESLLNESDKVKILSDFLVEMQKPTFIQDTNDINY